MNPDILSILKAAGHALADKLADVLHGDAPRFPVSDHCDGRRFFNPWGVSERNFSDLLRWSFARGATPWPESVPTRPAPTPPERVTGDGLRVTAIGHSTTLIQTGGVNILTDPVWSQHAGPFGTMGPKRVRAPGLGMEQLPHIHAVLVSHNHYDHLDLPSLTALQQRFRPLFVAPLGNARLMERAAPGMRCRELDWWESVELAGGVRVYATPAHHWSARGMADRRNALWASFMLEAPGGNVLFMGDTGFAEGAPFRLIRERFGPCRLALLPIGAYEPRWFMAGAHMNPDEAVRAFLILGAQRAIALHHGVFQLTDEGIDAPLKDLQAALERHGVDASAFATPDAGEAVG